MADQTQATLPQVHYPESDGLPMSDNTLQFEWIAKLKGALDFLFLDQADVFVAGDLLWYPVEGDPKTRKAPDAMVVFGRPKGHRGSYKQWEEAGIPPQVVFEVISPSNTQAEMVEKFQFYHLFGVEEFYILDPEKAVFWVWNRPEDDAIDFPQQQEIWRSPRLGIQLFVEAGDLHVCYPNGEPVEDFAQTKAKLEQERDNALAEIERLKALLKQRETGE